MLSIISKRLRERQEDEEGFTLLELLIVIGIIGIMSLIAIPIFMNQREVAAVAAVKSELRNAAMEMEHSLLSNSNKYPAYLPNYIPTTSNVEITMDKDKSGPTKFCLNGRSTSHANVKYSYDSSMGGLLAPIQTCLPVPLNQSFKTTLASKKVLIVYTYNASDQTAWTNYFTSLGYGSVTYMNNPSILEYKNYDVIAAMSNAWTLPPTVVSNLKAGFGQGSRIITDGNDNGQYQIDSLISESVGAGVSAAGKSVTLSRTGNKITPNFPYTFENTSFGSDSGWQCITKLQPGAVSITNSIHPSNSSLTCITGIAAANTAGGQWVHFSVATREAKGATEAAMDWLTFR
jgi:type IV pilus assembly protein PilA